MNPWGLFLRDFHTIDRETEQNCRTTCEQSIELPVRFRGVFPTGIRVATDYESLLLVQDTNMCILLHKEKVLKLVILFETGPSITLIKTTT